MGKVWVLDTGTKGTGARMVPLDDVLTKPPAQAEEIARPRKRRPRPPKPPAPREPYRFKVLDVMTRETLAEDERLPETLDFLRGVRSPVDVNLYVWEPENESWRLLTLSEKRAIWDLRDAQVPSGSAAR
jgi:hypothetical protein